MKNWKPIIKYNDKFLDRVGIFFKIGGISLFPFVIMRDTKMGDLGYEPIIDGIDQEAVKRMKWFDSLSAGKQHTDFFANRVTNYSKGVQNWDADSLF